MKKLGLLICLLVIFPLQIFPQTGKKTEIKRIDAYRRQIDAFARRYKSPQLIFADSSDYNENEKPKWQRYRSEKEFEQAQETQEFYDIAYVWRRQGRIVLASFTQSSPSGDWAKYVFHYFRPDGSLAKVESELRTFYGNLIVRRQFYFDRRGRSLKRTLKYLDLQTKKPKTPDKEFLEGNADFVNGVEYYKRTSKLPFANLLGTK